MYQLPGGAELLGIDLCIYEFQHPDLPHDWNEARAGDHRAKLTNNLKNRAFARLHDQSPADRIDKPGSLF